MERPAPCLRDLDLCHRPLPWWLDGNIIRAFVWWAGAIAFFALLRYLFVNLANILYFSRIEPSKRNIATNVVVPVVGLIVDGLVLYKAFFESLWNIEDFRDGRAIVLFCLAALAFDPRVFPVVWLWGVYGGWRGIYTVALEAWTSWPSRLDLAIEAGRARPVAPRGSIETEVLYIAFDGLRSVSSVGTDGRVTGDE